MLIIFYVHDIVITIYDTDISYGSILVQNYIYTYVYSYGFDMNN